VAASADILGLPVLATEDINGAPALAALHGRRPHISIVVAFGQILGNDVLALPTLGTVNLHFSLLPRWRGAAPVQRALEAGDLETGVTVQRVVRALDAGPVVAVRRTEILPGERAGELESRLADLGAALLADVLCHAAESGTLIEGREQNPAEVTRARKVYAEDGVADLFLPAETLALRARAFHPWPLLHAELHIAGKPPQDVSLHRVTVEEGAPLPGETPGTVRSADAGGIVVVCGKNLLRITELQRAGGKAMSAGAFLNGVRVQPGDRFA
jgi:methionyl-tRNA formyltransferase